MNLDDHKTKNVDNSLFLNLDDTRMLVMKNDSSVISDEILNEASRSGVSKINVDTDLRLAMTGAIRKVFAENPSAFDPRKYLTPARDLIKETVQHKIKNVFGSSNKALLKQKIFWRYVNKPFEITTHYYIDDRMSIIINRDHEDTGNDVYRKTINMDRN